MKNILLSKAGVARSVARLSVAVVAPLFLLAGCAGAPAHRAEASVSEAPPRTATLDKEVLDKIQAATFEVVVRKPEKDSLSYEKALPLDLLPYSVRTDKYESRGTAFTIAA